MAATYSDASANAMLNALKASALFVSLHSADPGENGADELSGNGYARKALTSVVAEQALSNSNLITFGPASAEWDEATHFGLWTAVSGGTYVAGAELNDPVTLPNAGTASLAAEALVVSLKVLS